MLTQTRHPFEAYLARHPGESARLHALHHQIAHDLAVSDRSNMAGHITSSVLVFDAARPAKGEGPHWHHDFLFVAIATHPFDPTPQMDEVNGVEWLPIEDFLGISGARMQHLAPKLRRFLAATT